MTRKRKKLKKGDQGKVWRINKAKSRLIWYNTLKNGSEIIARASQGRKEAIMLRFMIKTLLSWMNRLSKNTKNNRFWEDPSMKQWHLLKHNMESHIHKTKTTWQQRALTSCRNTFLKSTISFEQLMNSNTANIKQINHNKARKSWTKLTK